MHGHLNVIQLSCQKLWPTTVRLVKKKRRKTQSLLYKKRQFFVARTLKELVKLKPTLN